MIKRLQWSTLFNKIPPRKSKPVKTEETAMDIASDFLVFEDPAKLTIAEELVVAHQEIALESIEKTERVAELAQVKEALAMEHQEKEKMATELVSAQEDLVKAENTIQAHVDGLEEIMFMTSHKVRQPIANILGIANILDQFLKTPATIKKMVDYIKESTLSLDGFTKELSLLVNNLKKRK